MALVRPKNIPTANLSGIFSLNNMPAGSVVQTVTSSWTTPTTLLSAGAITDQPLSVTFTPKFSNSKFIINMQVSVSYDAGGNSFVHFLKRSRDGTVDYIHNGQPQSNQLGMAWTEMIDNVWTRNIKPFTWVAVDIPGAVTNLSYFYACRNDNATSAVGFNYDETNDNNAINRSRGQSSLTVYEIKQ